MLEQNKFQDVMSDAELMQQRELLNNTGDLIWVISSTEACSIATAGTKIGFMLVQLTTICKWTL